MQDCPTLAIIGGTGALGPGLALRWAAAGYPVVLGSRSREKAEVAAREIEPGNGAPPVRGYSNEGAAGAGNIVVIALADAIGTRGIDGGALANSAAGGFDVNPDRHQPALQGRLRRYPHHWNLRQLADHAGVAQSLRSVATNASFGHPLRTGIVKTAAV
jgi:NAD(P)-dependent dehydrogenase (short-subunit alcohol dehydrogenase family)